MTEFCNFNLQRLLNRFAFTIKDSKVIRTKSIHFHHSLWWKNFTYQNENKNTYCGDGIDHAIGDLVLTHVLHYIKLSCTLLGDYLVSNLFQFRVKFFEQIFKQKRQKLEIQTNWIKGKIILLQVWEMGQGGNTRFNISTFYTSCQLKKYLLCFSNDIFLTSFLSC